MIKQTLVALLVSAWGFAVVGAGGAASTAQENAQPPAAARNYWAFKLPVQAPLPAADARFDHPIDR